MNGIDEAEGRTVAEPATGRKVGLRLLARLRVAVPFMAGVVAALLALFLYNALNPPAQPLTVKQVNSAVAQAMASATPAPAFSAQAYRAIQPSLVLIQVSGVDGNGERGYGLGSGVVISERGEILTALHVVEGASAVRVTFIDGSTASAEIASTQPENDIAVLQPDRWPEFAIPAVMGNPGAVQVGDEAYAVGNPFGLYNSISAGVISGFDRAFTARETGDTMQGLIQIDTAVNPGSSGGPLLNRSGQVIGIVVGILNPTEAEFFVGVGFAVPIDAAAGGGDTGNGPQF